jgi:hypothetical protein
MKRVMMKSQVLGQKACDEGTLIAFAEFAVARPPAGLGVQSRGSGETSTPFASRRRDIRRMERGLERVVRRPGRPQKLSPTTEGFERFYAVRDGSTPRD